MKHSLDHKMPKLSHDPFLPSYQVFPRFACARVIIIRVFLLQFQATSGNKENAISSGNQPDREKIKTKGDWDPEPTPGRTTIDGNLLINISLAINKQIFPLSHKLRLFRRRSQRGRQAPSLPYKCKCCLFAQRVCVCSGAIFHLIPSSYFIMGTSRDSWAGTRWEILNF